jgi:hypothetical protein
MLKALVKHLLQVTGRSHLASFAQGLFHLGRPSSVAFPPELVEQGAAIALSGLANTMAIQSNPDWVWPVWVVRQTDPDDPAFVPTGLNLITTNLTGRNWTSVGVPGSSREAMVDPVGMVTPAPWSWSVLPCLRRGDRLIAPPLFHSRVVQSILPGQVPGVRTVLDLEGLSWRWDVQAAEVEGRDGILVRIVLENNTTETVSANPGISLRPANPLSLGPIRSIKMDPRRVRIDGSDAVLFTDSPHRSVVSDRHNGDPLIRSGAGLPLKSLRSRSGMATCVAEWACELAPGASWDTSILVPLGKEDGFRPVGRRSLEHARERMESVHRKEAVRGTRLWVPDERLQAGWDAIRGRMHVFDDGDKFTPGTFLYHEHWFRDAAFLALGFENLGRSDLVEPKMEMLRARQKRDGLFRSQTGEWDSNGQAIWTLGLHLRRGGRVDLLERLLPHVLRGVEWIRLARAKSSDQRAPHRGLLPAGFSAEHFGPNDHYFWDNFWSVAGMEEAVWMARLAGRRADADRVEEELSEYRADLESAMSWALERCDGALPSSPYRRVDAASIGNLVAISPLGVVPPDASWVAPTLAHIDRHCVRDGLFFQSIVHTGLNPYLSVQLARVKLAAGDAAGCLEILCALCRVASPTWCWPEALHPRTGGGCMGDGDHGWAAAEFLSLLREIAVREVPGGLELLSGVPREWIDAPRGVRLSRATTRFGTIEFGIGPDSGHTVLSWGVVRKPHQDVGTVSVSIPSLDGIRHIHLLPSLSGRARLSADQTHLVEIP